MNSEREFLAGAEAGRIAQSSGPCRAASGLGAEGA